MTEGKPNRRISHVLLLPNKHSQQTVVAEKVWYQSRQWKWDVLKTSRKCYEMTTYFICAYAA